MTTDSKRLQGLYAITDSTLTPGDRLLDAAEAALSGGVRLLQYRDKHKSLDEQSKDARALRGLCDHYGALLIVNDDLNLAVECRADGIHLGKDDSRLEHARTLLGEQAVIGISCYNCVELALQAQADGADYIAFGRFFPSKTKPDTVQAQPELFQQAREAGLTIPMVGIGGIQQDNAQILLDAGADMLAVIHGIFGQKDIEQAASDLADLF